MATLSSLKRALRQQSAETSSPHRPLSDLEYSNGFDILTQSSGCNTYQDFIIPQLSSLLAPLCATNESISVLEIGPGPKSVLGYLPCNLRRKIRRYTAFEVNRLHAARLHQWIGPESEADHPFPCLDNLPDIRQIPFSLDSDASGSTIKTGDDGSETFDVVLFCHSMYGMTPKHMFVEKAVGMLAASKGAMVVVFHRDSDLHFAGLLYQQTASYSDGIVRVEDNDEILDRFGSFIAGHVPLDPDVLTQWRKTCHILGHRDENDPKYLLYNAPDVMIAFDKSATALSELTMQVPLVGGQRIVKNREARLHRPAAVFRPTSARHVQQCVQWALKHERGLTVIGGGHSGHCIQPNAVAIDTTAFNRMHVVKPTRDRTKSDSDARALVVAEAGCHTGDIIKQAMEVGLTVPLGSRPSVGTGLWLQGGIGHLSRFLGLSCDSICGAVVVSVASGQVLCVGHVPKHLQPDGAINPENDTELMWALKGAGTNFGILLSVTFRAYPSRIFLVRNWVIPLPNEPEARQRLDVFDRLIACKLPRECSSDAYLFWDDGMLRLGITAYESSTTLADLEAPTPTSILLESFLGRGNSPKIVDAVGLFDTEMYMSGMHGGHAGGKTSSFKRCVFIKAIGSLPIVDIILSAIQNRPTPQCYLHLLHGGGAVREKDAHNTAFACRDWDFACVVTGVWARNQDGTDSAQAAVQWVYDVVGKILPLSNGAYGADLGKDPRDAALAAKAFGPNRIRLSRLKQECDPSNILAYACPLAMGSLGPRLVILVTGGSCAGKDYCASIWTPMFSELADRNLQTRTVSISDVAKREYADATGTDVDLLLQDREYKEKHRPALTKFFHEQVRQRPKLPEEHFLSFVSDAEEIDVLIITGMRDEAPVTALSHLVPGSRLLDVRIEAGPEQRNARRCPHEDGKDVQKTTENMNRLVSASEGTRLDYKHSLIFINNTTGDKAARGFAETRLLLFFHNDLQKLSDMVRLVPGFPRPDVNFRHVLNIAQQPGGSALYTSLIQSHFTGDWSKVDVVACCEAGGLIFGSALASQLNKPLVLIREAGKLPPPTISVVKHSSHISSGYSHASKAKRVEMDVGVIPEGASVVVVDDVLASGRTLCAVLELLGKAGVDSEKVYAMMGAEFPVHRGREYLRQQGFGGVCVQSLLVFDGA